MVPPASHGQFEPVLPVSLTQFLYSSSPFNSDSCRLRRLDLRTSCHRPSSGHSHRAPLLVVHVLLVIAAPFGPSGPQLAPAPFAGRPSNAHQHLVTFIVDETTTAPARGGCRYASERTARCGTPVTTSKKCITGRTSPSPASESTTRLPADLRRSRAPRGAPANWRTSAWGWGSGVLASPSVPRREQTPTPLPQARLSSRSPPLLRRRNRRRRRMRAL